MLKMFKELNLTTQGKISLLISGIMYGALVVIIVFAWVAIPAAMGV